MPLDDACAMAASIIRSLDEPLKARKKLAVAMDNLERYNITRIEEKYDNMLKNLFGVRDQP